MHACACVFERKGQICFNHHVGNESDRFKAQLMFELKILAYRYLTTLPYHNKIQTYCCSIRDICYEK